MINAWELLVRVVGPDGQIRHFQCLPESCVWDIALQGIPKKGLKGVNVEYNSRVVDKEATFMSLGYSTPDFLYVKTKKSKTPKVFDALAPFKSEFQVNTRE